MPILNSYVSSPECCYTNYGTTLKRSGPACLRRFVWNFSIPKSTNSDVAYSKCHSEVCPWYIMIIYIYIYYIYMYVYIYVYIYIYICMYVCMVVSWNRGTPNSSIFNGIIHYKPSLLGIPPFVETPIYTCAYSNYQRCTLKYSHQLIPLIRHFQTTPL